MQISMLVVEFFIRSFRGGTIGRFCSPSTPLLSPDMLGTSLSGFSLTPPPFAPTIFDILLIFTSSPHTANGEPPGLNGNARSAGIV
jgi:hypothetical protein